MGDRHPIMRYRPKDPNDIREYVIPGRKWVYLPGTDDSVSLCVESVDRRPKYVSENFDLEYFIVLDEDFCQPYTPFYEYISGKIDDDEDCFPFLFNVVDAYYHYMDECDWMERCPDS